MSNNGHSDFTRRIQTVEQNAPPVSPAEALRRNLLYAMFKAVSADDMRAIVAAQVEKAKDGDGKAARLIMDMVQAGGEAQPPRTHMQQAIVVQGRTGSATLTLSELRQDVVRLIAAKGPLKDKAIVEHYEHQNIVCDRLVQALDHPWFEREADGYHLTTQARTEVLASA